MEVVPDLFKKAPTGRRRRDPKSYQVISRLIILSHDYIIEEGFFLHHLL
jgi:hypothetical protein